MASGLRGTLSHPVQLPRSPALSSVAVTSRGDRRQPASDKPLSRWEGDFAPCQRETILLEEALEAVSPALDANAPGAAHHPPFPRRYTAACSRVRYPRDTSRSTSSPGRSSGGP